MPTMVAVNTGAGSTRNGSNPVPGTLCTPQRPLVANVTPRPEGDMLCRTRRFQVGVRSRGADRGDIVQDSNQGPKRAASERFCHPGYLAEKVGEVTGPTRRTRCPLGCAPGRRPRCRDSGGGSMGSALVMV